MQRQRSLQLWISFFRNLLNTLGIEKALSNEKCGYGILTFIGFVKEKKNSGSCCDFYFYYFFAVYLTLFCLLSLSFSVCLIFSHVFFSSTLFFSLSLSCSPLPLAISLYVSPSPSTFPSIYLPYYLSLSIFASAHFFYPFLFFTSLNQSLLLVYLSPFFSIYLSLCPCLPFIFSPLFPLSIPSPLPSFSPSSLSSFVKGEKNVKFFLSPEGK